MEEKNRFIENFEDVEIENHNANLMEFAIKKPMPIGSVVQVKNANYMIIGYNIANADCIYDYLACIHPMGLTMELNLKTFNHEDIERIYHIGHYDIHTQKFQKEMQDNALKISLNTF